MLREVQYPFEYQLTGTGVSVGWYWESSSTDFQKE